MAKMTPRPDSFILQTSNTGTRLVRIRGPRQSWIAPVMRDIDEDDIQDVSISEGGLVQYKMSPAAAARMREAYGALPVQMLGDRPLFIAFTLPDDWRRWVPNAKIWELMRRNFVKRFERRWGPLVGVWCREFQEGGRPHMHWYIACPTAVPDHDYRTLYQRTVIGWEREQKYGKYNGRGLTPVIGLETKGHFAGWDFGGEFAMWMRNNWSSVVCSNSSPDQAHWRRGVDIRVSYMLTADHLPVDKQQVLLYMSREMGKASQKATPYQFGRPGKWWGLFGRSHGFSPQYQYRPIPPEIGPYLAARLETWVRQSMITSAERAGRDPDDLQGIFRSRDKRLAEDGVLALGLFGVAREEILRLAYEDAEQGGLS